MHLLRESPSAVVHRTVHRRQRPPTAPADSRRFGARAACGSGYLPDALPFAFFNSTDELVGFDIELAHRLAGELGVPPGVGARASRAARSTSSPSGDCDIVMSGVAVTTDAGEPYDAFRAPTSTKHSPSSSPTTRASGSRPGTASGRWARSRLAVPNVPYYVEKLRSCCPPHAAVRCRMSSSC